MNDSENLVGDDGALNSDGLLAGELVLLGSGDVLGDWHGEEVSLAVLVSDGLHVHGLEELHLVHEASEWVGPTLRDGLQVLDLVEAKIN